MMQEAIVHPGHLCRICDSMILWILALTCKKQTLCLEHKTLLSN